MNNFSSLNGRTLLNMVKLNGVAIYDKYKTWLDAHPDEPYCYAVVTGSTFGPSEADNPDIIKKHPELTGPASDFPGIVSRGDGNSIKFSHICSRWCAAIREMTRGGSNMSGEIKDIKWLIEPDKDNFIVTVTKL